LLRGDIEWRRPGFRLAPMPVLAVGICVALRAAGAWASRQLSYRSGTRVTIADADAAEIERDMIDLFFDTTMIVEAPSVAETEATALGAAAIDVAALAQLVPVEARRVDSPGSFVLPHAELEARKRALLGLKLDER